MANASADFPTIRLDGRTMPLFERVDSLRGFGKKVIMLDYTNALDRNEACDTLIDWIRDNPMMSQATEMLDVLNRLRPGFDELEAAEE